jgi:hypothetical protein
MLPMVGRLLKDQNSAVTRRVASDAVARLGGDAAVKLLVGVLGDPSKIVRLNAAKRLCEMGRREGVPTILAEGYGLGPLNALRSRETWEQLFKKHYEGPHFTTRRAYLEDAARQAGMALLLPTRPHRRHELWLSEVWWGDPGPTLAEMLGNTTAIAYDYILEPGRIRILPAGEARAFWKAWWKGESQK